MRPLETDSQRWGGFAVAAFAIGLGVRCAGGAVAPGAPPTEGVAVTWPDAGGEDASDTAPDVGRETTSSASSDWPGWRRVSGVNDYCVVDVPSSLSVPPLSWTPCSDGTPDCTEMELGPENSLGKMMTSHDVDGRPALLAITRVLGNSREDVEVDLYEVETGQAAAAFRFRVTSYTLCDPDLFIDGHAATLVVQDRISDDILFARASPATLMLGRQKLARLMTGVPKGTGLFQVAGASDSTFAFDLQPVGTIHRARLDGSDYVTTIGRGGPHRLLDLVERDGVFAKADRGSGWREEHVFGADGSPQVLRANATAHVGAFATDGINIGWTESFASDSTIGVKPSSVEIWTAPYTANPQTLAATARRIAVVNALRPPSPAVLNGDYYVANTGAALEVTRISDGMRRTLVPRPGWQLSWLHGVTSDELWTSVYRDMAGDDTFLRRYKLSSL
jgi:hypothetical protein